MALQPDDKQTIKIKRKRDREKRIATSHLVKFSNILIGIDQFLIHKIFFLFRHFLLLSIFCLLWWQMNIFNGEKLNMMKLDGWLCAMRDTFTLNLLESHINRLNGTYFCLDKFNQFILLMKFIYSLSIFNPFRIIIILVWSFSIELKLYWNIQVINYKF